MQMFGVVVGIVYIEYVYVWHVALCIQQPW